MDSYKMLLNFLVWSKTCGANSVGITVISWVKMGESEYISIFAYLHYAPRNSGGKGKNEA